MLNPKDVALIIETLEMLSRGIDPISGIKVTSDSILNNIEIKNRLYSAAQELKKAKGNKKGPFVLSTDDITRISCPDEEMTISNFVKLVNSTADLTYMNSLRTNQITNWLVEENYLEEKTVDDCFTYREATQKGVNIGITSRGKISSSGVKYVVNYYSKQAMTLILDNLNEITARHQPVQKTFSS